MIVCAEIGAYQSTGSQRVFMSQPVQSSSLYTIIPNTVKFTNLPSINTPPSATAAYSMQKQALHKSHYLTAHPSML